MTTPLSDMRLIDEEDGFFQINSSSVSLAHFHGSFPPEPQ